MEVHAQFGLSQLLISGVNDQNPTPGPFEWALVWYQSRGFLDLDLHRWLLSFRTLIRLRTFSGSISPTSLARMLVILLRPIQ